MDNPWGGSWFSLLSWSQLIQLISFYFISFFYRFVSSHNVDLKLVQISFSNITRINYNWVPDVFEAPPSGGQTLITWQHDHHHGVWWGTSRHWCCKGVLRQIWTKGGSRQVRHFGFSGSESIFNMFKEPSYHNMKSVKLYLCAISSVMPPPQGLHPWGQVRITLDLWLARRRGCYFDVDWGRCIFGVIVATPIIT